MPDSTPLAFTTDRDAALAVQAAFDKDAGFPHIHVCTLSGAPLRVPARTDHAVDPEPILDDMHMTM